MKSIFWFLTVLLVSTAAFGQVKFVPGYFINNEGQRTDCEIRDMDWQTNPVSFEYRIGQSEAKQGTIGDVKEFGITNGSVYRRFAVGIDRTSDDPNNMSTSRNPEFKGETLFLRLLITGKGTLYEYYDNGLKRYFYQVDQGKVEQLIYLRFLGTKTDLTGPHETGYIESNNQYKQQLFNDLKCGDLDQSDFSNLKYERGSLIKIFRSYNNCQGGTSPPLEVERESGVTHVNLRAGVALNGFSIADAINSSTTTLDRSLALRVGVEIEVVLPFSNHLWSVVAQPDFQSYSSTNSSGSAKLDYKSIDIGVSVRRYFLQTSEKSFYLGFGGVYSLPLGGSGAIKLGAYKLDAYSGLNVSAAAGYRVNKVTFELFYGFGRDIMHEYVNYSSSYGGPGLMIGYRLK